MSRRSKFNPHTMNAILEAISIGCTFELAAERAGISRQTLYNWILQGKKAKHGKFYDFVQQLKRAESRSAVAALATINKEIQQGNLKAAFFLLERRHNYKRDQIHQRSAYIAPAEEQEQAKKSESLRDVLQAQSKDLREAMDSASKKESWQAYAALQRQLLQVLSQLRALDAEAGQLDDNHHLSDDQLMDDITAVIVSLPPLARQRIINDLQSLSAPNIIPINQKK